ncbi:hypothetical protein KIN20_026279 [Parelaphostrongylus tenuis]|uniref:Uncharacterized protein n=1 Tax=Parelaphostrongylus tenuis TaxID=148309 RepID=A0AAD5MWJ2_PARTN|nr:hypothetical protein KIN20_026279 [Parelaphostrongylus tenuis]
MESFEVTDLYTYVSNDSTLQGTHELQIQHQEAVNMYGLSTVQYMVLLKVPELLNIQMVWENYAQMRGLAMGQRLASSLKLAFMSKVEAPVMDLQPLLYCSYDFCRDSFDICQSLITSNQSADSENVEPGDVISFTPVEGEAV